MNKNLLFSLVTLLLFFTACSGNSRKDGNTGSEKPKPVPQQVKPIVNVYIENSGSMDGYVKGITEFEQTVYNYVSDIIISHTADSVSLFYINSEVLKYNAPLEDFIQKLEPTTFKQRGGNRGTSDIANVLGTVLQKTDKNEISILVTDGIFSPGRGKDAEQYLVNQQIGIKRRFAEYLEHNENAAVVVYQFSSNFDGIYYNKVDAKKQINEPRPYYLWVIGDAKQVSKLRESVPDSKFINGVQNVFTAIVGNHSVKYAINPSVGKFKKSRTDTYSIENLEKDSRNGKVQFAVNADFSDLLLDDSYLLNADNYENSSKYTLTVKPNTVKNGTYSHIITFTSTDRVYSGNISVKLKAQLPGWVETANDDEGTTAIKGKTYGIKYQLGGVFDAFTFNHKYHTEIKININ